MVITYFRLNNMYLVCLYLSFKTVFFKLYCNFNCLPESHFRMDAQSNTYCYKERRTFYTCKFYSCMFPCIYMFCLQEKNLLVLQQHAETIILFSATITGLVLLIWFPWHSPVTLGNTGIYNIKIINTKLSSPAGIKFYLLT